MENDVITNPLTSPSFAQASQIAAINDPAMLAREFDAELERAKVAHTAPAEPSPPTQPAAASPQTPNVAANTQGGANTEQSTVAGKPEGAVKDKPSKPKKEYTVYDAKAEYVLRWRTQWGEKRAGAGEPETENSRYRTGQVDVGGLAHDLKRDGYNDDKTLQAVLDRLSPEDQSNLRTALGMPDTRPPLSEMHKEALLTAGKAVVGAGANAVPDTVNGFIGVSEALTFQKPGTYGRMKEWYKYDNEHVAEAARGPQAVFGTALAFGGVPAVRGVVRSVRNNAPMLAETAKRFVADERGAGIIPGSKPGTKPTATEPSEPVAPKPADTVVEADKPQAAERSPGVVAEGERSNKIFQRLEEVAKSVRAEHIQKPIGKGNVAASELHLSDGTIVRKSATSRAAGEITERPTPKSEGGLFEPSVDPKSKRVMDTDAEYKLYDTNGKHLKNLPPEKQNGKLYLYTETEQCASCNSVMEQFQKMFPDVSVEVRYTRSW